MTATETWLKSIQAQSAKQVGASLTYDERSPDDVAEHLRLGNSLGLPPTVIQAEPKVFQRQEAQQKASTALSNAPATARWLSDLTNGGLAKDDIENLSWFENQFMDAESKITPNTAENPLVRGVGRSVSRAEKRARSGFAYGDAAITADLIADYGKTEDQLIAEELAKVPDATPPIRLRAIDDAKRRYLQIKDLTEDDIAVSLQRGAETLLRAQNLRQAAADIEFSEPGAAWRDGPLADAENSMSGFFGAVYDDPIGAAAFIAEVAAEALPALAVATGATVATRSPAAGASVMGANSYLVENSETALAFLQEQGISLDTPEDAVAALQNAEMMAEASQRGLERGIVIAVFDALSGGIAGQRLARSAMGDVVTQGVAQAALAGAGETLGQMTEGKEIDVKDVALEMAADVVTAPAEVIGVGGRGLIRDLERRDEAGATAQALDRIDEMAAQSKLKQRSPEKFAEALEAQGGEGFYVPSSDLRELFQAKDLSEEDGLAAWGIDVNDFAEAEAAGLDVMIPRSSYAAYISGTDDATWVRTHAVQSPDEMSMAEAARFNDEWRDAMEKAQAEADDFRRESLENRASDLQVHDNIYEQLREAGRSTDVARREAQVWTSFWRTMGERYGEDPLVLAQRMGVVIRGPQEAVAGRRRGDLDIALNTLRSQREGALRPSGSDLLEFVRSQGGVSDIGGDVEAMDAPKGVIAETRADYEARRAQPTMDGTIASGRGKGLDEIGRAAIEAGYFPEFLGGADIQADGTVVDEASVMLEALQRAISGEAIYPVGEGVDADLSSLRDELSRRALDLNEMSNDEIVAALEDGGMTYNQDGTLKTDTPEFKAWFGDSKVVDENGDPLVVYRAMNTDAEGGAFRVSEGGTFGDGIYLASDPEMANEFTGGDGGRVFPVYASIQNPAPQDLVETIEAQATADRRSSREILADMGYDGMIAGDGEIIAFTPTQIKSVYNRGTFDGSDPRILYQDGNLRPDSEAFRNWAGTDSPVLYPDEINDTDFSGDGPWVMRAWHGTTHDFEAFDASVRGNKEGQFGAVNYFSSSKDDASGNYGADGQDLTNRIEQRAERLQDRMLDQFEEKGRKEVLESLYRSTGDLTFVSARLADMDDADAAMEAGRVFAQRELKGGTEKTLGVFIRTEKPFVVGGEGSPFIEFVDYEALERQAIERVAEDEGVDVSEIEEARDDYEDQINDARWEIESETESPLIVAISEVASRYDADPADLFEKISEVQHEGTNHTNLENILRSSETIMYAEDPEDGGMVGYHMLAEIVEALGFDSIILKDADVRFPNMGIEQGTAHVHVFDSHNTNIKSVDNTGTFNREDSRIMYQSNGTKRASIVLPRGGLTEGQTVINLFEQADLSSFLHESGHFFLEAFTALATSPDAPQAMKNDLAAIHKFLDVKSEGNAESPASATLSTAHHEKWARGFEAYLMEGKAPSLELADAFARFKSWLTRIYRSITGLNVKLTPEIREVMDRMLATDAEINAAREGLRMTPLFTDQKAAGMSDAAWRTYQNMAQRSVEQAQQALLEKTMAKVKREKEKWWKDERAAVRKQVEGEINSKPEYRLIEMLANQRWIGSDKDVPDFQLDRKELVEMFGEGVLAEFARSRIGGKRAIYGPDGLPLNEAADFFGFVTPSDMVTALQNSGKRLDVINTETDRVMLDRYGDPFTDGTIEQEALEAIHSDQQANTVASEVRHLAGRAGLPTRNLTAKAFRQRARMMLGRMTTREATKPNAFLEAERRAAKRSEDAFARVARGEATGEAFTVAARHKEQQLLNHYLYLESRDLKALVDSKREKMRGYSKKSVREKLEGGYIEQIDALLDQYDFRVRSPGQVTRDENLREFVQRMENEGRGGELAIDDRLLERAKKVHYSTLPVDELRGLFDTIENIDHMGRFKQKLIDAKEKRDLDEIVSKIGEAFDANVSGSPPSRTADTGESRKKLGRDYLNSVLNADTLLREIDGFKDMGPTWTAMKQKVDEGMSRLVERRQHMAKSFDDIYSVYSAKEKREMSKKVHNKALGVPITKWELLTLALNTGNENNFQRLTNEKVKGSFKQGDIEAALAELDTRDWETVQSIWDYIGSYWEEIAAKEKRQTGVAPERVPAKVMTNAAPGFIRGGYYPIKYDNRLSGLTDSFQQKELAETLMGGMFGKAQTRNGHTKARANSSRQPVMLDLSVAHSHVEQVIYDLELGEPLSATWKILQAVKPMFYEKGKQSDFNALELWAMDVAAGERIAAGGLQTVLRHVRSGFTVSRLALNISTALIQPTGLVQSAVLVGKRAVAKGTISYMSNIPRWVNDVKAVSPLMRERQLTFERDIFNVVGDLQGGPVSGWSKMQRDVILPLSFIMMQKVQFYTVDMPTWVSAYEKEIAASGDEAKARTYADLMVKRAQGSGLMSDRGMLERGTLNKNSRQQEFPRMLTALGSYMFAKGNVAYEKTMSTDFKNPVEVMKLAADIALLFTFEAVLYSAVKGYLPEEDEEWAAWLAKETAFSMMSTLPYARELSGAMQGFGGGGIFGSGVEVLARPITQAEQGEFDKSLVNATIDAGGVLFHLPSSQVKAGMNAFFEQDMSLKRDPNPFEALGIGSGSGRSIADFMFND